MVYLFYTTYISVDLAHHKMFHARVGKGGIMCVVVVGGLGSARLGMMKIEARRCNMLICLCDGSFLKIFLEGDINIWKNQILFPHKVIKLFSFSIQLSMNYQLLIITKMQKKNKDISCFQTI